MEIWNNVFIQYNRNPDRSLTPLPAQHVDTGMGFERIIQVLQGKDDNYGIDLFDPFWAKLKELSGITYSGKYPEDATPPTPSPRRPTPQLRHDIAFRVIADHIRCLTFALTDGAVPSNEGRGYVLRRILRRAVRFGRQQLGAEGAVPAHARAGRGRGDGRGVSGVEEEPGAGGGDRSRTRRSASAERSDRGICSSVRCEALRRSQTLGDEQSIDSDVDHRGRRTPSNFTTPTASPSTSRASWPKSAGMTVDIAGYEKLMEEARELARSGGKEGDIAAVRTSAGCARASCSKHGVDADRRLGEVQRACRSARRSKAIWDGIEAARHDPRRRSGRAGRRGHPRSRPTSTPRWAARSATRASCARRAARCSTSTTTRVGRRVRAARRRHGRRAPDASATRHRDARRRAAADGEEPHRHPPRQLGAARSARRRRAAEGLAGRSGKAAVRLLARQVAERRRARPGRDARRTSAIEKKLPVYAEEAPQEQALKINGLRAVFGEKYPPMVRVVSIGVPVADLLERPGEREVAAVLRRVLRRHAPQEHRRRRGVRRRRRRIGQQGHPPDRRPHR